jgi:hypothetical protein
LLGLQAASSKPTTPNTTAIFGNLSADSGNLGRKSYEGSLNRLSAVGFDDSASDSTIVDEVVEEVASSPDIDSGQPLFDDESELGSKSDSFVDQTDLATELSTLDKHAAEDAATSIQRWYRRRLQYRRAANAAALKSMLDARRSLDSSGSSTNTNRPRVSRHVSGRGRLTSHVPVTSSASSATSNSTVQDSTLSNPARARPSLLDDNRLKAFKLAAQQRAGVQPKVKTTQPTTNSTQLQQTPNSDRDPVHEANTPTLTKRESLPLSAAVAASVDSHGSLRSLLQLLDTAVDDVDPISELLPRQVHPD